MPALLGLRGPPGDGQPRARPGGEGRRDTGPCTVHTAVLLLGPLVREGVSRHLAPGRYSGCLQAKQGQGLRGRRGVTAQRAPAHVCPPGCLSDQLQVLRLSPAVVSGRGAMAGTISPALESHWRVPESPSSAEGPQVPCPPGKPRPLSRVGRALPARALDGLGFPLLFRAALALCAEKSGSSVSLLPV